MKTETTDKRPSELLLAMERLTELHTRLLSLIHEKIEHMRAGSAERLQACTAGEESLLETIGEQEGLRRQLADDLGRGLGIDPQVARRMPARQLADDPDDRRRAEFANAVERLRGVVGKVADANRVATLIAQQVLGHLRCVFEAVATPDEQPAIYSPHGRMVTSGTRRLFEMTG